MITRTKRLTIWLSYRLPLALAALAVLLLLSSTGAAATDPIRDEAPKKALIFSSYDPALPGVKTISETIQATFKKESPAHVQFYQESLDNLRIPESRYEDTLVTLLKQKYEEEKIDVIFAIGSPALKILLKHRADLLPDIPIIFYFVDETETFAQHVGPNATGIWTKPEYGKTLEIALALHPETEQVVVVAGNSRQDRFLLGRAQEEFRNYEGRAEFTYLTDLTIEELQQKLASLPEKSIVIFLTFFLDRAGRVFSGPEALSLISPSSNAPIYGMAETYLGSGIVGGSLFDYEALGRRMGELGLRIINGERPGDMFPRTVPSVTMFDWRELQRWGLHKKNLPPGSLVRFTEPSFWERYEWYIIAGIGVGILEALLIAGLLINSARRRRAEKESLRLAGLAEDHRRRLNDLISNVPGVVWESLIEPSGATVKVQFVSSYIERLLGYSIEEWTSTPNFLWSILHDEDREKVTRQRNAILAGGKDTVFEFRWRAKDGRVLWAEGRVTVIRDESGAVVGLRGVTFDITNRKEAEAELVYQATILASVHDAIVASNAQFKVTAWNHAAEELYGWRAEEALGRPASKMLGVDITDAERAEAIRRVTEEGWVQTELVHHHRDGTPLYVQAYTIALRDKAGRITGYVSAHRDVTERKKVEEALRHSERRNRDIIRALPDLVFLHSMDGEYLDCFTKDSSDLLLATTEFIGKNMRDVLPPDLNKVFFDCFRRAQETGQTQVQEYMLTIQGEPRWFEARIVYTGEDQLLSVVRNITERRRIETQLIESEERFRHMADTAPVLIWLSGPDKRCTYFNQRWLDFTGRPLEAELGAGWAEGVHPDDYEYCLMTYMSAFDRREPFHMEYRLRRADGEYRWVYDSAVPRFSASHKFLGYIGSCIDVTDNKLAEEALRRSNEELQRLNEEMQTTNEELYTTYEELTANKVELQELNRQLQAKIEEVSQTNSDLRNFMDSTDVASIILDRHLCVKRYTPQAGRLFNIIPSYINRPFAQLIHRLGKTDLQEAIQQALDGSQTIEREVRSQDDRWYIARLLPYRTEEDKIDGVVLMLVDITDRKRTEEALQEAFAQVSELKSQLEAENLSLKEEIRIEHNYNEIIGNSEAIRNVLYKIEQVAPTDTTVLILGETGTGKELVARALHSTSLRKDKPLVKVNCAALPASLIESELFGHEKGAFTSATARRLGRFELANGGTIFLDEIGDLPLELQVKLLRVLQEGEFERLGSGKTIKVDVRIITATNRNLPMEIEKGVFREDLFYRLNVFPITVPPLRERREDISLLVEAFVQQFSKKHGKTIVALAPGTMKTLKDHSWPGNVRELANVIERAMVNSEGTILRLADQLTRPGAVDLSPGRQTLEELERQYILRVLKQTGWRIEGPKGAARILGLNPSTLRTRMAKLKIQKAENGST